MAVDVARMLVTNPEVLALTDIARQPLESSRSCGVEEVLLMGRRGPLQSAFTTLELPELGEIEGVDVMVDPADLEGISDEDAAAAGKIAKNNVKVLHDYAGHAPRPGHRRIMLRFLTSPIEIKGDDKVESIVLGRNDYAVGWIKRGPSGVIGTNKKRSQDTVDTVLNDLAGVSDVELVDLGSDYADQLTEWLTSRQPKLVTACLLAGH